MFLGLVGGQIEPGSGGGHYLLESGENGREIDATLRL
jgi:hypothetical protein